MTKRNKRPVTDHLAESNAFLREVDDTMRLDRMTALWLQYRTVLFVGLGVVFCSFAGVEYYNQSKEESLQAQAETYWNLANKSVGEGSVVENFQQLANQGAEGYRLLAQFQIAYQFVKSGKTGEAIKVYNQVANDTRNKQVYRDLAKFYEAQVVMDKNPTNAAEMFTSLVSSESAYTPSALEMLGHISESTGDMMTAKSYYEQIIATPGLSRGIMDRAQSRLDVIARLLKEGV